LRYSIISRRKIVGGDRLVDVTDCSAEREDTGANDRREPAVEAIECRDEAKRGEAKARSADLELEGAVRRADGRAATRRCRRTHVVQLGGDQRVRRSGYK
jgi:hypothetical protein